LRHQDAKLRTLAKSKNESVRKLCARFKITDKYDFLHILTVSIGVPLDARTQDKRATANAARDRKMEAQASPEGKQKRKNFKMRNRVHDRNSKKKKAAAAKAESIEEFAQLLQKDVAETLSGREYGSENDPLIALVTLLSVEMAAPTQSMNCKDLRSQVANDKKNSKKKSNKKSKKETKKSNKKQKMNPSSNPTKASSINSSSNSSSDGYCCKYCGIGSSKFTNNPNHQPETYSIET
jgi:hypothetical protein